MLRWLFLAVLVVFVGGSRVRRIVGGSQAEDPGPEEDSAPGQPPTTGPPPSSSSRPPTFVQKETWAATLNGNRLEGGLYAFLGLKYAHPPVGKYRFQRPRMLKLEGEINATKYGPPCPQPTPDNKGYIGEEDCLYLNVFTPKIPQSGEKPDLPVLFWIHGGHFRCGSAAQYDPKPLVEKGVVVVTIQYRLGSLGFLSIGRKELPGNVGLFDIATALRWVRKYAHYFGGDSKRIVAAGQGSGASCATMLALSKQSNQIAAVFAMSGSPVSPFSVDKKEKETAKEVSAFNGCKVEEGLKFVRCMQNLPLETIMKADNSLQGERMKSREFPKNLASLNSAAPSEEGPEDTRFLPNFIVESPLEAVKKGKFPPIPLLTGVTKEETSSSVKGNLISQVTDKLLSPSFLKGDLYNNLLQANTGLYKNKTVDPQLVTLFSNNNYLEFFTQILTSTLSDVEKVIKHTTDAFFNLPAFVTTHLWSKRSKAYLYSFEHIQKEAVGEKFLSGLPLAKQGKSEGEKKGPSHGDDLIYLFNLQSLEGKPLDNAPKNEADKKVRDLFTFIVAEFAKTGVPKVIGGVPSWPPFSGDNGEYMIIAEKPELAKNFRKCQMGMWTGDANILGSGECSFIGGSAKVVTDTIGSAGSTLLKTVSSVGGAPVIDTLQGGIKPVTNTLSKPLETIINPLGGILGGQQKTTKAPSTTARIATTTKKQSGGLFGLGGLG